MRIRSLVITAVLATAILCSGFIAAAQTTDTQALATQLQAQIASLMAQIQSLQAQQGGQTPVWYHTFNTNLGYAQSGTTEVGYLHTALDNEGISYSPDTGNTYSEPTLLAVKQFQTKYRISQTGYVGPLTRAKLNALYGDSNGTSSDTSCTPKTCTELGKTCGNWDNGCEINIDCGSCTGEKASNCVPKTCTELGKTCGTWWDGCGGTIICGLCSRGQICRSGACCTPKTCEQLGKTCGSWDNGCGTNIDCGTCPSGKTCNSDGTCALLAPLAPGRVTASLSGTTLTLTWSAVIGATSYIYKRYDDGIYCCQGTRLAGLSTIVSEKASGSKSYYYDVFAVNDVGTSLASRSNTVTSSCGCDAWGSCINGVQMRFCPVDCNTTDYPRFKSCIATCTPNWQIGEWSACVNGQQMRTVTDSNDCGVTTDKPAATQTCTASCTPNWSCGAWGACSSGLQGRICADLNNCFTTTGKPETTRTCTVSCLPYWQCTAWSACVNGQQTRTCTDLNKCGVTTDKPATTQTCIGGCTDSDGGKNPDVAGTVTAVDGTSFTDKSASSFGGDCSGSYCNAVDEGYCTADGKVSNIVMYCSTGYSQNGACATAACTPNWQCSEWNTCVVNGGQQYRTCTDANWCGTTTNKPIEVQSSCTVACRPNWYCTLWSACVNGKKTQTCTDLNNCGVTTGKPIETESCGVSIPTCTPNWQCTEWSVCGTGWQNRTCTDWNSCGVTTGKPAITQSCTATCTDSDGGNNPTVAGTTTQTDGTSFTDYSVNSWGSLCSGSSCYGVAEGYCGRYGIETVRVNCPGHSQNGACDPNCIQNWQCTEWGTFGNGYCTRICTDANGCGSTTEKPVTLQLCTQSYSTSQISLASIADVIAKIAAEIQAMLNK